MISPAQDILGRGFIKNQRYNMKSKINTKELADLAKLSFSEKELSEFETDMENIVSFATKVMDAKAEASPLRKDGENVLRCDILNEESTVEISDVAPRGAVQDEYFAVPRVVAE